MRAKWSAPIRKYWKISEQMMVKYCDLAICDSVNIEKYIHECYDGKGIKGRNPKTTFIAYGADLTLSKLADNDEKLVSWYKEKGLTKKDYQVTLLVEAEKVLSNAELASGEQIGIKILDSQITALEAELERYSNLKIRLYQDLCDDVVSREEYGEMNTRFAQKIKEAQDKIQEIREKKQEALKHDTLLPTWLEEFKQYEHIKTLERRVVVELIDHIDRKSI